ncbi:energy transducer TonB [Aestuariivivens marinum]|uniref:energy transducer TonB n=1 Tax=Aestuariivivens marinum TaxID=2913555 RepID=UPI00374D5346
MRVLTQFTINEEGQIVDIKARGSHPVFENEAIRIIKMIPQLEPPSLNEKPVSPRFSLPIIFAIQTEKQKRKRLKETKS